MEVFCQLCSKVLCAGNCLKGTVIKGAAGVDPAPFLCDSGFRSSIQSYRKFPGKGKECNCKLCLCLEFCVFSFRLPGLFNIFFSYFLHYKVIYAVNSESDFYL